MAANLDNGVILGALGSTHTDTTAAIAPPTGMIIAAIQFITKNTPTALVAENPDKTFNTAHAANSLGTGSETVDEGSGGIAVSGCEFPAGMTVYGRWTSATFAADSTGGVICYFGY
tara:strand:- start:468 stop:815 length:348 start_codon:yes stop_codon:yes gene_type:complete